MSRIGGLLGALALSVLGAWGAELETPPTFRASEILPPYLAAGDYFRVVEKVRNDGYLNHFQIESDFGDFEAQGQPILIKRVQEVHALAELAAVSKTKLFAESAATAAKAQVTAIADFAERPVETVKGVPDGVKRMFKKYKRDAKEIKEANEERREEKKEKKAAEGTEDEKSTTEEMKELGGEAAEVGTKYAKSYFGSTRAERKWAQQLGVDPYTSNQILLKELKEVARVDAAGGFTMKFAPIPRIPGVRYLGKVNSLVWSLDPRALQEHNQKLLIEMGIEEELLEEFFDSPWLSPSRQTRIVAALVSLEGVDDVALAIDQALGLEAIEQAYFFQQSLEMLAYFHSSEEPLARLLAETRVPTAVTRSGKLVAFASVDHISWTEEARDASVEFVEDNAEVPADRRELVLRGAASELFRQELEVLGMTVRQDFGKELLQPASTAR